MVQSGFFQTFFQDIIQYCQQASVHLLSTHTHNKLRIRAPIQRDRLKQMKDAFAEAKGARGYSKKNHKISSNFCTSMHHSHPIYLSYVYSTYRFVPTDHLLVRQQHAF